MKKIFTLATCLFMGIMAGFADDDINKTFEFTYADGTVVENGATITAGDFETDPFTGQSMIKSGLYVHNTTDKRSYLAIEINVQSLPNGDVQLCFPSSCQNFPLGKSETQKGGKNAGTSSDLQTEWLNITSYGAARVSYRIVNYDYILVYDEDDPTKIDYINSYYEFSGYGPSVTVNYVYSDPSGINSVKTSADTKATYYTLSGAEVANPTKGVYVVKTLGADSKQQCKKVVLK